MIAEKAVSIFKSLRDAPRSVFDERLKYHRPLEEIAKQSASIDVAGMPVPRTTDILTERSDLKGVTHDFKHYGDKSGKPIGLESLKNALLHRSMYTGANDERITVEYGITPESEERLRVDVKAPGFVQNNVRIPGFRLDLKRVNTGFRDIFFRGTHVGCFKGDERKLYLVVYNFKHAEKIMRALLK